MPQAVLLYHTDGIYEPALKFYLAPAVTSIATAVAALTTTGKALMSPQWRFNRWEHISALGVKVDEGALDIDGTYAFAACVPSLCAFIRLNSSPAVKRPSSKYLHGLPADQVTFAGPLEGWLDNLAAWAASMQDVGVVDSDGSEVTGATFRKVSQRDEMNLIV